MNISRQFVAGAKSGAVLAATLLIAALAFASLPSFASDKTGTPPTPQLAAAAQFDHAQKQRAALEATPESQRTVAQYISVVKAYRAVYLITPKANDVPFAILMVADLYHEMGDRFDTKYYQVALDTYQYLLHDYPQSRYREDALFGVAQIQKDDLNERAEAQKSFEQFLQLHPHSLRAPDARKALAELTLHQSATPVAPVTESAVNSLKQSAPPAQIIAKPTPAKESAASLPKQMIPDESYTEVMEQPAADKIANVHDVKAWNTPDYTRLVINLDGPVTYQAARISNPDRIYFDVSHARLAHSAAAPVQIEGDLLKSVRVAQNQANVVRIVLETGKIKDYSVFLLRDPYRMVVDVHAKNSAASAVTTAANLPAKELKLPVTQSLASPTHASNNRKIAANAEKSVTANSAPPADDSANEVAETKVYGPPVPSASSQPSVTPINNKSLRPKTGQVAEATPVPAPTRDGQQSLSRALGLKVGHIVIDAGHGGHDTGTVGPTGLMEKDLCLDVALRLGQLIQERLPGTEITYTRSDDTFVPLEERTNIANQAKADLFLSIHANSSPDSSARGVETYYLNFSPSPEAMQVAARENATAQNGVHDLDDLIQRIERNEKIEESRELATDIQDSLTKDLQRTNHSIRNRGVRKAPFVVLIGANMPSVLAEISFISNPTDESSLEKPEGRERVAEGLFQGVEAYLQSTNSVASNQAKVAANGRSTSLASSGNQR